MKLDNHIARTFLLDDEFAHCIVAKIYPNAKKAVQLGDDDPPEMHAAAQLFLLLNTEKQKAYYITESVLSKLEMLKVSKKTEYVMSGSQPAKNVESSVINDGNVRRTLSYDWSVFDKVSHRKITLILPDNQLFRIMFNERFFSFAHLKIVPLDGSQKSQALWALGFVSRERAPRVSRNWTDTPIQEIEGTMYKLLCFLYMTENEEILVEPGAKHGTRKTGKVVNSLTIPVTIVNNNWNITSIRTEGFDVSGHLRMQPTKGGHKLILIEPFKKHGYVRKAKPQEEK